MVLTDPPYFVRLLRQVGQRFGNHPGGPNRLGLPVYAEVMAAFETGFALLKFYGWPHADTFISAFGNRLGFAPSVFLRL